MSEGTGSLLADTEGASGPRIARAFRSRNFRLLERGIIASAGMEANTKAL